MKRFLSLVLSVSIVLSVTAAGFSVSADTAEEEREKIYYSDLFYGYADYLDSYSLNMNNNTAQLGMANIFTEYVNSSAFKWAAL